MKNDLLLEAFKDYEIPLSSQAKAKGGMIPPDEGTTYEVVGYSGGGTANSTVDYRLYYWGSAGTILCGMPDSDCGTNSPYTGMTFTVAT